MKKIFLNFAFLALLFSQNSFAGFYYGELDESLHAYLVASLAQETPLKDREKGVQGGRPVVQKVIRQRETPENYRTAFQTSPVLVKAYELLEDDDVEEAAVMLFNAIRGALSRTEKLQAAYLLGQALMRLGFDEVAAFQFVGIIKAQKSPLVDGSVELLTLAASNLGDDSKINYSVSRLKEGRYKSSRRDIFSFRKGELYMRKKKFKRAAKWFSRVRSSSSFFLKAKYNQALAYARGKDEARALRVIEELVVLTSRFDVTDPTRVTALLAKARILYQGKKYEQATQVYRQIPKDSVFWHDTLFEQSWAYLMSAKFRSALSNFHSLHSPYYEKFYIPESLILRAIVYLYICNYQEVEKVVQLFEKIYVPLNERLRSYLKSRPTKITYYNHFTKYVDYWLELQKNPDAEYQGPIPEIIARHIMKDGEMRKRFSYLETVRLEASKLYGKSKNFQSSPLGAYISQLLNRRIAKAESRVGSRVKFLMRGLAKSLQSFVEQNGYLRFEVTSAQKLMIKKKMYSKLESTKRQTIDEDEERDFYIQNGFDYWPFRGEYWLDEIGNYHYLGVQSCGK